MTKIVFNACFGGFSLSHEAILRYAEIKGITVYPEQDTKYPSMGITTYWLKPEGERPNQDNWNELSLDMRAASNKAMSEAQFYDRTIPRNDPALVQVVEELGPKASGRYAKLMIAEVEEGTKYRIDEYDGNESVMTVDDYDWLIA